MTYHNKNIYKNEDKGVINFMYSIYPNQSSKSTFTPSLTT